MSVCVLGENFLGNLIRGSKATTRGLLAAMSKSICLATIDFEGLVEVGGIGSYYAELARLLSRSGWNVTVLFHSTDDKSVGKFAERYYRDHNIPIYSANDLAEESGEDPKQIWRDASWHQARSHVFHEALRTLVTVSYTHLTLPTNREV